jgi:hypothetical protein
MNARNLFKEHLRGVARPESTASRQTPRRERLNGHMLSSLSYLRIASLRRSSSVHLIFYLIMRARAARTVGLKRRSTPDA